MFCEITCYTERISKAATVLSALMIVYTIPCHDRGHVNIMLVLQSCSDPLHILPSLSSQTNAPSDGVCNFNNIEFEEDVDEIEEVFLSINEEVDRGVKQEEVPGDMIFPDIKSKPDEVSYICICLLLEIFYECLGFVVFLVMSVFLANLNNSTVGNKNILLWFFLGGRVRTGWVGGRVCTGWDGGRACTGWVGQHVIAWKLKYIIISM